MIHGNPSPKNTLTLLEPVTFPIALSAYLLCCAACLLAKVSGNDVPSATNVIAVAAGFRPITHPNNVATSPTKAVTIPINAKETRKASHPLHLFGGGINAKNNFQPIVQKCKNASTPVTSIMLLFSSNCGESIQASLNCILQVLSSLFCNASIISSIPLVF
jgi:hypothetical protein